MPPTNSVQQEPQTDTPAPMVSWVVSHGPNAIPRDELMSYARLQDALRADLLAALVDLVDGMDEDPMFDAARAAIARATGVPS